MRKKILYDGYARICLTKKNVIATHMYLSLSLRPISPCIPSPRSEKQRDEWVVWWCFIRNEAGA
jgi:hypothetical protein